VHASADAVHASADAVHASANAVHGKTFHHVNSSLHSQEVNDLITERTKPIIPGLDIIESAASSSEDKTSANASTHFYGLPELLMRVPEVLDSPGLLNNTNISGISSAPLLPDVLVPTNTHTHSSVSGLPNEAGLPNLANILNFTNPNTSNISVLHTSDASALYDLFNISDTAAALEFVKLSNRTGTAGLSDLELPNFPGLSDLLGLSNQSATPAVTVLDPRTLPGIGTATDINKLHD
jgi:hypothetical protein